MPINDTYVNTPGFVAQINDNGLQVASPPQAQSQSVLLLGVATDGPVNTPIQVASIADAERIFGVTTASTSITGAPAVQKALTRGIYEAFQAGATSITLCRVGGTSASSTLVDSVSANSIILTENYAGGKYNALLSTVTIAPASAANVAITTLDNITHKIPFTPGVTLAGDLINTINAANLNIQASQGLAGNPLTPVALTAQASTAFTGGTDGTTATDAQYADNLSAAYAILEQYPADVIVPLGAYLQPTMGLDGLGNPTIVNANLGDTVFFGQNLAQFVARLSSRTKSAVGVISIAPLAVPTYTNAVRHANQVANTAYTFTYAGGYSPAAGPFAGSVPGSDGNPVDLGYLLNIVAGPDAVVNNPQIGNYVMDGAATYAGRIVSLAPQSATTNKPIDAILGLTYNLGASLQDQIIGQRFVIFTNINGVVRTAADQTYSKIGRDFTKLSTLRVVYKSVEATRNATQQFIGEPANPAILNAMGTAIDTALKQLKASGALLDYGYQINATSQDQINGNLRVTLALVPALQIRKIILQVSLKPAASF